MPCPADFGYIQGDVNGATLTWRRGRASTNSACPQRRIRIGLTDYARVELGVPGVMP
jgi:hypothetical protein